MKSTNNKLGKWARSKAALMQDIETVARNKRTEYHNTAVTAYNAEIHALNGKVEYLIDIIAGLSEGLVDAHKEINGLKVQLMKSVRTQGSTPQAQPHVEYITETTTVERVIVYGSRELQQQYCKGVNINWKGDIPAVEIAFNEFDLFRADNNIHSMITPEQVKRNWGMIATQSPKLMGMTLGRLLKVYADARKLNY